MTTNGSRPWLDEKAKPFIKIDRVTKRFGGFTAVDEVTLDIFKGELFALLGGFHIWCILPVKLPHAPVSKLIPDAELPVYSVLVPLFRESKIIAQTIASMGANNLLIQPGTASSGGVSFGSGSVITLTPQDADAILRECRPAVAAVAPVVRARTQVVHGNRNWVPLYIYGTTPSFLDVRDWEQLEEGEPFTDRDVSGGAKVDYDVSLASKYFTLSNPFMSTFTWKKY